MSKRISRDARRARLRQQHNALLSEMRSIRESQLSLLEKELATEYVKTHRYRRYTLLARRRALMKVLKGPDASEKVPTSLLLS